MARKKVPLRYICDHKARGLTFKKRRNNLMKKADEVGVLCKTKACVLVYPEGATVPQVYPSHAEAVAILTRYKDAPDLTNYKKTVTQEEFLTQRVAKLQNEREKLRHEREDREVKFLLHKAMLGGTLTAVEVTRVAPKLEAIIKSLGERIVKTTGQPPVFQPQAPDVRDSVDMGPPPTYQAPPQWQEGWQTPVIQPQAPHFTGSVDMRPPPMYQAPPHQQEGWQPPDIQSQASHFTGSLYMGPPPMNRVPPQQEEGWQSPVFQPRAPYVTGNFDIGPTQQQIYQAPQQQEVVQMSDGDHDSLVYDGHNGADTTSSFNNYDMMFHGTGDISSDNFSNYDMMFFGEQ